MLRILISSALSLLVGVCITFVVLSQSANDAPSRERVLVSIAELMQRESEVTRELHMLKFGQTLNLMALLESEQNFAESNNELAAVLDEKFVKNIRELNRAVRLREKHVSDFKSSWAIQRNSRSSVLRMPARIVAECDPTQQTGILSYFHELERDFLVENDIDRHLRTLPARLSKLEDLLNTHATASGVEYFAIYKRHLDLYISSRASLIEAVHKSEEFSIRPAIDKIRDEMLDI